MQIRYLIFSLIFIVGCRTNNNKSTQCILPDFNSITNYVDKYNPDTTNAYIEVLQRFGFHKNAFKLIDEQDNWPLYDRLDSLQIPKNLRAKPATEFLDIKAKEYDIIMLNENHCMPQHRVFAQSLLETLKKNGYKYLALETIMEDEDKPIIVNGAINYDVGYYTKEVHYSNFLKDAIDLGFYVFGYEPNYRSDKYIEGEPKIRDLDMCYNILDKWNKEEGKLFIYCGFGHSFNQKMSLRSYLENENPELKIMSINQIILNQEIKSQVQNKIREKVDLVSVPSVLLDSNTEYTLRDLYEAEIIHPLYSSTLNNLYKYYPTHIKYEIPEQYLNNDLYFYNSRIIDKICNINPIAIYRSKNKTTSISLPTGSEVYMYKVDNENTQFISKLKFE